MPKKRYPSPEDLLRALREARYRFGCSALETLDKIADADTGGQAETKRLIDALAHRHKDTNKMPHNKLPGARGYVAVWEDFLGDTGAMLVVGNDTGATAVVGNKTNGVLTIATTSQPAAPMGVVVRNGLGWKMNQGKGAYSGDLHIATRLKQSLFGATGKYGLFVGFSDVATSEMPIFDTGGSTDKALASNAAGIGWNNQGDTGWVGYAVDGDTVQEVLLSTEPLNVPGSASGTGRAAPTANKYVELEVHLHRGQSDTGGAATFYIDGLPVGYINNPLNVTTNLVPCIWVYDTGGAATLDVDWVNVWGPRDTGE